MTRGKPMPVLFLTAFLDLLGFGIIIPLLPFVAQSTGANVIEITLLMASYSLMQFLMAPVWGHLSDRIGRRPVLLTSIGGSIIALFTFSFSTTYAMLLVARLVHGAMNANIAVAQAAISDITTPETRAKGMGIFGAAFGLGFVFGPALGGLLGGQGLRTAALAATFLAIVNLASAFLLLPETRPASARNSPGPKEWRLIDNQVWRSAGRAPLRSLIMTGFLVTLGFAAMESVFSLWSQHVVGWGALENGLIFSYLGVLIVLVQGGLIGPLRRRFTERSLALVGIIGLTLGLALLPLASTTTTIMTITSILAIANGILQPNLSALVTHQAEPREIGRALGSYQSANALARVGGPLLAGGTFSLLDPSMPFIVGALSLAAAGIILLQQHAPSSTNEPVREHPVRDVEIIVLKET